MIKLTNFDQINQGDTLFIRNKKTNKASIFKVEFLEKFNDSYIMGVLDLTDGVRSTDKDEFKVAFDKNETYRL